jgi:hypothetical protein
MVTGAVQVLRLQCEHCGGPLAGLPDDVVFICRQCALGYEATLRGYQLHPVQWWHTRDRHRGNLLYLPFWAFTCRTRIVCEDARKLERYTEVQAEERIYVKGFSLLNSFAAGNPGLDLTRARPRPRRTLLSRPYPALVGCRRSSEEARAYLQLFLLSIMDREEDVTGVQLELEVDDLQLLGVPFFDDGRDLRSSFVDRRYPAPLITDVDGMRRAGDRG